MALLLQGIPDQQIPISEGTFLGDIGLKVDNRHEPRSPIGKGSAPKAVCCAVLVVPPKVAGIAVDNRPGGGIDEGED